MRTIKSITIIAIVLALAWPTFLYAESQTTSGTLASTIIDQAREFLGDPTTYGGTQKGPWGDAEMLQYLNDGTMAICKMGALEDIESETLVENQIAYTLADSFIRIKTVVYNDEYALKPGSIDMVGREGATGSGYPEFWTYHENDVIVYPKPGADAAGNSIDVYVIKQPTAVAGDANVLVPAQYDLALVYFIVAQAYGGKDGLIDRGAAFMALFNREMGQQ